MELTVAEALERGIAAHRAGKLQDAEHFYRAILQAQPKHPDANHNLGVLAVSVGKPLEAIPLFKLALEANSQVEQQCSGSSPRISHNCPMMMNSEPVESRKGSI